MYIAFEQSELLGEGFSIIRMKFTCCGNRSLFSLLPLSLLLPRNCGRTRKSGMPTMILSTGSFHASICEFYSLSLARSLKHSIAHLVARYMPRSLSIVARFYDSLQWHQPLNVIKTQLRQHQPHTNNWWKRVKAKCEENNGKICAIKNAETEILSVHTTVHMLFNADICVKSQLCHMAADNILFHFFDWLTFAKRFFFHFLWK